MPISKLQEVLQSVKRRREERGTLLSTTSSYRDTEILREQIGGATESTSRSTRKQSLGLLRVVSETASAKGIFKDLS